MSRFILFSFQLFFLNHTLNDKVIHTPSLIQGVVCSLNLAERKWQRIEGLMNNEFIRNRNVMCLQFSLKMHHFQDVITNSCHVIVPHIHQFIHEILNFSIIRYLVYVSYSNQKFLIIVALRYPSKEMFNNGPLD